MFSVEILSANWNRIKDIVPGYVFNHIFCSRKKIIPLEIFGIISCYCKPIDDVFDENASQSVIKVNESTPNILQTFEEDIGDLVICYAFGTFVAIAGYLYYWKLELLSGTSLQVGITDNSLLDAKHNDLLNIGRLLQLEYIFDIEDGKIFKTGEHWKEYSEKKDGRFGKENVSVHIEFDMRNENNCTLKFYVNNECNDDIPFAYENIDSAKNYRLMLSLQEPVKIQIMCFAIVK